MAYIVIHPDGNVEFRAGTLTTREEMQEICGEGYRDNSTDRFYLFPDSSGNYTATVWVNYCATHNSERPDHPPVNLVASRLIAAVHSGAVVHGTVVIIGRDAFHQDPAHRRPLPFDAQEKVIEAMGDTA